MIEGSAFEGLTDLGQLRQGFGGVTTILEAWFGNYKGPGRVEVVGWGDAASAAAVLLRARQGYSRWAEAR